MNTLSPRTSRQINWSTVMMFVLGFWLSASVVFDFLVIPGLLTSGMMNESGFASASYLIFETFNHVELLCAAIVLAGCLVFRYGDRLTATMSQRSVFTAGILLIIALVYTYFMTPQMSSMGLSLNLFDGKQIAVNSMAVMHFAYWSLEVIKLIAATVLLRSFYRNSCTIV
ncbi:MAG: hypothetical protein ACFCU5_01725 [Pleurocapsa sp.]